MKYPSILALALVVVLSSVAHAQGEDEGSKIKAAIADYLTKAEAVWADGKDANRPLRRAKRKAKDVATVINKIRHHVRGIGDVEPAPEKDAVQANCDAFIGAAEALVKFDTAITPHIDALSNPLAPKVAELEKRKSELEGQVEAVAAQISETDGDEKGALEEKKAEFEAMLAKVDAELLPIKHRYEILEAADETVWRARAEGILTPFLNQGTYLGMFDSHIDDREKLLEAFLNIFINLDEDTNLRVVAGEGVAQFVRDSERAAHIAKVKETFDMVDEQPAVRQKAMFVLARIGERGPFDQEAKAHTDRIAAEQAKSEPNTGVIVGSYRALVNLYQGINDFKTTAFYNITVADVFTRTFPFERANAQQRQEVSFIWYNFACVLSRIEMIDQAVFAMEQSYNYGYDNFDWAMQDGDLENVRKDARFATMHNAFKTQEKKAGSVPFDTEKFTALVKPLLPEQATPANGDTPDEAETETDASTDGDATPEDAPADKK